MPHVRALVVGLFLASFLHVSADPNVRVSVTLHGDKIHDYSPVSMPKAAAILDLGDCEIAQGKTGTLCAVREFPYPVNFDPAESASHSPIRDNQAIGPVIPITPTDFKTQDIGWSIDFKPVVKDGLVCLQGTSTYSWWNKHNGSFFTKAVYGENTGPIYGEMKNPKTGKIERVLLSENKGDLPTFEQSITPFVLFAKPGKTYTVKLQRGTESIDATVKCEIL